MTSQDQSMEMAVASFKDQMSRSNKNFIERFIHILRLADEPPLPLEYDGRLDTFSHFIWSMDVWPPSYTTPAGHSITNLEELLFFLPEVLADEDLSGTFPPFTAAEREEHLQLLTEAVNEQADTAKVGVLGLPEDYAALLAVTDGVADPNFRQAAVCGFNGMGFSIGIHPAERVPALSDVDLFEGWEMGGGWTAGMDMGAACYYLFCRYNGEGDSACDAQREGGDDKKVDDSEWHWRIWYLDPEDEPQTFDSMVEFLEWYGSWADRDEGDERLQAMVD